MERKNISIRYTIFVYFTVTALAASLLITFSLYQRLSTQVGEMVQEENQSLIHQVARSVESYLLTVMKLSDSLYYGAVKKMPIFLRNPLITRSPSCMITTRIMWTISLSFPNQAPWWKRFLPQGLKAVLM